MNTISDYGEMLLVIMMIVLPFMVVVDIYTRSKYHIPLRHWFILPFNKHIFCKRSDMFIPERDGYLLIYAKDVHGYIKGQIQITLAVEDKRPIIVDFDIYKHSERKKGIGKQLLMDAVNELKKIDPEIKELAVHPAAKDEKHMPQEEVVEPYKHLARHLEEANLGIKLALF